MEIIKRHIFNWEIWPDFFELPERDRPVVQFEEMVPGRQVEVDGRSLEMVPVEHTVPAVGYIVREGGKAIAFSGDTATNDTLWVALNELRRLDLLIVECAFGDDQQPLAESAKHYCPSTLEADLRKLEHRPPVYVTHLKPGDETVIFEQILAAVPDREIHRLTGGEIFEL